VLIESETANAAQRAKILQLSMERFLNVPNGVRTNLVCQLKDFACTHPLAGNFNPLFIVGLRNPPICQN
jgi:hypothetical protein